MACPNCGNPIVDVVDEHYEADYHNELYQCPECGTVFRWESRRTIESTSEEEEEFRKKLDEEDIGKKIAKVRAEEALASMVEEDEENEE